MERKTYYASTSIALKELREKGYTLDFNLEENCLACGLEKFAAEDFEIAEVYRYEGDSNPDDESAVYGIVSSSGLKGVLVTGYGTTTGKIATAILNKL